ncbi:MAG: PIN domain-containing protein [Propionibacteriaceae bacterium]|jgi:predicted nucleic acid-binding protein|nr:PIN domain-containing protein [Propionibacteriaceae bacterium]
MRLVADTSVIVAAIVDNEPRHAQCLAVLESATHAYITPQVVTETCWLLSAAGYRRAAIDFLSDVASGFFELVNPEPSDYVRAGQLIDSYAGTMRRKKPKPGSIDLADAMNVIVAARQETTILATLDQDYRGLKPLVGPAFFTLLPDDE